MCPMHTIDRHARSRDGVIPRSSGSAYPSAVGSCTA